MSGLPRVLSLAGLAVAGALLGVVGAFLHAVRVPVLGTDVPVLLPTVLAVLVVVLVGGARATGSRPGAGLPAATWLLTTVVFAVQRPEGDLVVPVTGTWTSLGYVFGGAVVAGVCVGLAPETRSVLLPPRHRATEVSRDHATPAGYPPVGSSG